MNAHLSSESGLLQNKEPQANVLKGLQAHLPPRALLWQTEDTTL